MSLTAEAVRALAPDASALRAGQALASPARWSGLGRSERALWGACQGSGKDPYQVSVDLGGATPAAKCTCPSRKFSCKHALGLMLLAASNANALAVADPPAATADWLQGRDARAKAVPARRAATDAGDGEAATPVVDEKARARRIATRERRVEAGLEELKVWLRDLARRGLAEVVSEGIKPFEVMAARLVDAQAASVARSIRGVGWRVAGAAKGLPTEEGADADWADDLLDAIGRLYLLVETHGRRESLSDAMRAEVRTLVGWTIREAELPEDDLVQDDWLVIGRRHAGDERLRATRTYLRGRSTGRDAVLLDWEPSNTAPSNEPPVGEEMRGSLVFYPSATPLRAAVRGTLDATGGSLEATRSVVVKAPTTWRDAIAPYATALAANPWLERRPVIVSGVVPVRVGEQVVYRDAAGEAVPCRFAEPAAESLQSFSGGHPVTVFGEWNGSTFTVLAAGDGEAWVPVAGTTDVAPTTRVGSGSDRENAPWDALRAYAILGTSRATAGPELAPLLARMADRAAEDQVLALAASLAVRRRAQANVAALGDAQPLDVAPPEVAERASPAAARVLAQWLGEPVVVRDWLDRAAMAGVVVPAELLPAVLELPNVTRNPDAEAVLGKRWRWLTGATSGAVDAIARGRVATSTEAFIAALGDPVTGGPRFGLEVNEVLRPFRAHDAAAARGWIDAAWATLTAKGKDGAVRALADGIEAGDAPLIDRLVEAEKSKARREDLVTIACRVPGSAVRARIEDRARRMVGTRGLINRSLDVSPPDAETIEAMERDGMTTPAYGSAMPAGALRAAALVDQAVGWHVTRVAPARWSEWLKLKPADVLELFAGAKRFGWMLANALRTAAIAHEDADYAEVLLSASSTSGYGWLGAGLWPVVRPEHREQLMVKLLFDTKRSGDLFQVQSLDEALGAAPRPWSPSLVTLVRHEMLQAPTGPNNAALYFKRGRLKAIATHAPPELLPELETLVAGHAAKVDNPSTFDDVLEIVMARRALDAAFAG
jgi:hypothetical protein